jgi:S-layer protein
LAYTYDQLVLAYTAAHDGIGPDAATQANFQIQALQSANGQLTDAQLLANIVNGADNTTGLAVLAYQFFTGKSPTKAGIDYLVNSSVNTGDLNDPYYAKFGLENRYINFAANLGVQGEGAANFAGKYGALSFADYVASIYQTIIGASYATAAGIDPAKAIADIISRKDAILATAQGAGMIPANATAAQIDIALKAATAGYLLGEAIKADVGLYAAAANNFMVAVVQGTATYNTDVTISYQPAVGTPSHGTGHALDNAPANLPAPVVTPPAQPIGPTTHTFILTAGADHFTGEVLNDVFNADATSAGVLDAGDVLDGGAGQDTLNLVDSLGQNFVSAGGATVRNIETVNLQLRQNFTTINLASWTGVTKLNATVTGDGASTFFLGSPTSPTPPDITLTMSNLGSGNFQLLRGHDVTMTIGGVSSGGVANLGVAATGAATINLDHVAATSSGLVTFAATGPITVTQTASNAVGTTAYMAKVNVTGGVQTTSAVIHNAAEATADGTHAGVAFTSSGSPSVSVTDGGYGAGAVGVLAAIDIDGYSGVRIWDAGLTTLSLAHGGGDVAIFNGGVVGSLTTLALSLNGVKDGALSDQGVYRTLNITTGAIASTLDNITASAVTALNLSGPSHLTLTSASGLTALQTVTVTGAGGITANLSGATVTSVSTAASTGASTMTIDGGRAAFTGGAGIDTVALSGTTITKAIDLGGGNDTLTLAPGTGVPTATITGGAGTDTLKIDAANAVAASATTAFGAQFTGFETLALTSSTVAYYAVNLDNLGSSYTAVIATGAVALNLTATSTAITSVDASGGVGLQWTSGALTGAVTVKGGYGSTNIVDFSAATAATITYVGLAYSDTITLGSGHAHVIDLGGDGNNFLNFNSFAGSSATSFVALSGVGISDILTFNNLFSVSLQSTAVDITGLDLAHAVDKAALGDGSGGTLATWFNLGGDTYVVLDSSASTTFAASVDLVIKLTGGHDMSTVIGGGNHLSF